MSSIHVVDPTNTNIVYAAVGGFPNQGFGGSRGVWKSTDGGVSWQPNQTLFPITQPPFTLPGENWRIFTYHSFARDPVTGAFVLVWPDSRNYAINGLDILTSRSTDEGITWTAPVRLNDDPPGIVRDQMFPAITAAQ